jgi:hypothetical protein
MQFLNAEIDGHSTNEHTDAARFRVPTLIALSSKHDWNYLDPVWAE